jgi:hypothetical protein
MYGRLSFGVGGGQIVQACIRPDALTTPQAGMRQTG